MSKFYLIGYNADHVQSDGKDYEFKLHQFFYDFMYD